MSQDLLRQLIHQGAQFRKLVSEITTRIKELEEMVVSQFTRIQTLEAELRQYKASNTAISIEANRALHQMHQSMGNKAAE